MLQHQGYSSARCGTNFAKTYGRHMSAVKGAAGEHGMGIDPFPFILRDEGFQVVDLQEILRPPGNLVRCDPTDAEVIADKGHGALNIVRPFPVSHRYLLYTFGVIIS